MSEQVRVQADLSSAYALTGYMQGISTAIMSDKHMNTVMRMFYADLKRDFLAHMDALASSDPYKYHGVYEWGEIGVPAGRLYDPVMRGVGRDRVISWEWKASTKLVPVSAEAAEVGVKEIHVFVWKAPFFEYNQGPLEIFAKRGKLITGFTENENGELFRAGSVTVQNPGGTEVFGAFSTAFAEWWGSAQADPGFEKRRLRVAADLRRMPIAETARRKKSFTLGVASAESMIAKGMEEGLQYIASLDRDYIGEAIMREDELG